MESTSQDPSSERDAGAVRQRLRLAMLKRREANLLPYEGQWLPPSEVEARLRRERRVSWIRALELTLLYLGLAFVSFLILVVLWNLVY